VTIHYLRDGNKRKTMVTLKNKNQNTQLLTKKKVDVLKLMGADFQPLTEVQKNKFDVDHGIQVTSISKGSISKYTNMQKGFVITHAKRKPVDSVDKLISIVEDNKDEGVMVQGFYPGQPGTYYYAFGLS
jgi:S1-C subfamily serine protease